MPLFPTHLPDNFNAGRHLEQTKPPLDGRAYLRQQISKLNYFNNNLKIIRVLLVDIFFLLFL